MLRRSFVSVGSTVDIHEQQPTMSNPSARKVCKDTDMSDANPLDLSHLQESDQELFRAILRASASAKSAIADFPKEEEANSRSFQSGLSASLLLMGAKIQL